MLNFTTNQSKIGQTIRSLERVQQPLAELSCGEFLSVGREGFDLDLGQTRQLLENLGIKN